MATNEARAKILSVSELYTLPQTLVEVLRIAESPQSSAHDLSQIILRDAPVTARLLRMANSAMYGRSGQVKTVHQAVVLLGFRSVKSVVLSTAVYDVFNTDDAHAPVDLQQFWLHSLECATTAQLLAAKIHHQPQEEAFVAGLLHDLGILLMGRAFGDDYRDFLRADPPKEGWTQGEQDRFGIDHTEAGALVFSEWSMPENLIEVVARHHDALTCGDQDELDTLTLLVGLADRISHHSIEPSPALSAGQIAAKHKVVEKLGLNAVDLSSVDSWVTENLTAVAAHLEIEIGSPSEIVMQANQRLYELYTETEQLVLSTAKDQKETMARELLDAICATFSHHINNASTTIMGHSELVELAINRGKVPDADGTISSSMKSIQDAVAVISAVLAELKSLAYYDVVPYHDRAQILNIDDKVKNRLSHQRL
jgi:putative nucleotidyltransferase with HDIG domain